MISIGQQNSSAGPSQIKNSAKHSKKLPYWLWFIIAKSLGIKLHPNDKPLVSVVLHGITLFSGGIMLLTRIWFSGYDIYSDDTETDILDGIVAVTLASLFAILGVYSQRLAHRIFEHPKFLEMMRLHSKTILKLNASILSVFVLAGFIVTLNLATFEYARFELFDNVTITNATKPLDLNPCQTVKIPLLICHFNYFSQVIYSVFFFLWTAMIGCVLICISRTHTINIRRFIGQLEYDSFLRDQKLRERLYAKGSHEANDAFKIYAWKDGTYGKDEIKVNKNNDPTSERNILEDENIEAVFNAGQIHLELNDENVEHQTPNNNDSGGLHNRQAGKLSFRRLSESEDPNEEYAVEPKLLSEDELLHKYWKLVASTNLTSTAFQRWMCLITISIMFWSAVRIVYWLSHTPTPCGVLALILPLLLLPLVSSAYAEVNYEGQQVLVNILPTAERSGLFRYLYGMPIQLTVYNHPISYGTMGTVFMAILAAFASRILIQEVNKII